MALVGERRVGRYVDGPGGGEEGGQVCRDSTMALVGERRVGRYVGTQRWPW